MVKLEYQVHKQVPIEVTNFINDAFHHHNKEEAGIVRKITSISVKRNNKIVAAGRGHTFGKTFYIEELIVGKAFRNENIGTDLLKELEKTAKNNNCNKITVSTFSYQGPQFYTQNNYIEIARLENRRDKHSQIFFEKEFIT